MKERQIRMISYKYNLVCTPKLWQMDPCDVSIRTQILLTMDEFGQFLQLKFEGLGTND